MITNPSSFSSLLKEHYTLHPTKLFAKKTKNKITIYAHSGNGNTTVAILDQDDAIALMMYLADLVGNEATEVGK